jgi:hypothetical protein
MMRFSRVLYSFPYAPPHVAPDGCECNSRVELVPAIVCSTLYAFERKQMWRAVQNCVMQIGKWNCKIFLEKPVQGMKQTNCLW